MAVRVAPASDLSGMAGGCTTSNTSGRCWTRTAPRVLGGEQGWPGPLTRVLKEWRRRGSFGWVTVVGGWMKADGQGGC